CRHGRPRWHGRRRRGWQGGRGGWRRERHRRRGRHGRRAARPRARLGLDRRGRHRAEPGRRRSRQRPRDDDRGDDAAVHNLKLSLGSVTVPPWNASAGGLSMVALVEPLRPITAAYPSPYPANIYGESVHTALGDELTSLALAAGKSDFVSAQTEVGEAGQPIAVISKGAPDTGTTGRAYAASLFEVQAIARLAKAQ